MYLYLTSALKRLVMIRESTMSVNKEILCQVLMYLIHTVPRLSNLFLKWSCLTKEEKYSVSRRMLSILQNEGKVIFIALNDALIQWDSIQDTQGAPGFHMNFKPDGCEESIEKKVADITNGFDLIISTIIDNKRFDEKLMTISTHQIKKETKATNRSKSVTELNNSTVILGDKRRSRSISAPEYKFL